MTDALVILAVLLAATFALSVWGKARSGLGQETFAALRLPVRTPRLVLTALIAAEAVTTIGLTFGTGWILVGAGSLSTLLTAMFCLVVIRAHLLGSAESCGCFGEVLPARVGGPLILRNLVLFAASVGLTTIAVVEVVQGIPIGLPAVARSGSAGAFGALLALGAALVVAATVWLTARAASSPAPSPTSTPAPLPAGSPAPSGALLLAGSPPTILPVFTPSARARLLVFWKGGCPACDTALHLLSADAEALRILADVYAVRTASAGELPPSEPRLAEIPAIDSFDIGGEIARSLTLGTARPAAVLVSTEGAPVLPVAVGSDRIAELLGVIAQAASERAAP